MKENPLHVTIPTRELSNALKVIKPAVAKRSGALPVLTHARLDADAEGRLTISATDLDLTIRHTIAANVTTAGSALASAASLGQAATGKGVMRLESGDGHVKADNGILTLVESAPLDDYPRLRDVDGDVHEITIDRDVIASVIGAASDDDARPILTGVWFSNGELACTDSYRLHVVRGVTTFPVEANIPARALRLVLKAVKSGPVRITLHCNPPDSDDKGPASGNAQITAGDTTWITRLIEGSFPNYRQLIPTGHPYAITFPRPAMSEALVQLAKQTKGTASPVRIGMETEGSGATLPMRVGVVDTPGAVTVELPGAVTGPGFAANPEYMIELIAGLRTCTIRYVDSLKPFVLTEVDDNGAEHIRLQMPVRVS